MERYLCIHGHFYQPPRENPWLEAVEIQDSAYPYHDWNERITSECYSTNGASRILDESGRITDIVSNYAKISFDMGPTLLGWLEKYANYTYGLVLEADRLSAKLHSGHGSAIAQSFNHMIMPLANRRDKKTQVVWGIKDFVHRFGREPEGMWLPETAVDVESLEIMAEQGIKFTILAPHQAKSVRPIDSKDWQDVTRGRIDPSRAYVCNLPSGGRMNMFFYDAPISHSVAFEGLLDSGVTFAKRLLSGFNDSRDWPQIVHIATDGESYGHHHRFGDMALAYALHYIESNNLARITNYGEYLAMHKPAYEVEIIENTSWSCAHGIERWRSDCGCSASPQNGWNQKWRAPLREALDWLRDEINNGYDQFAPKFFKDPWAARDGYIDVILDRSGTADFISRHSQRQVTPADSTTAIKLLEMQRHAMLMYTSCGWFFDDISGIETVQVLQYAGRAIQLAKDVFRRSVEKGFMRRLEAAKSNIEEQGNGSAIYERQVKPSVVDLLKVCAHFAISSLYEEYPEETGIFCYKVVTDDYNKDQAGSTTLVTGKCTVTSEITGNADSVNFCVLHLGGHDFSCGARRYVGDKSYGKMVWEMGNAFERGAFSDLVRLIDKHFGVQRYSLKDLFRDEQRKILDTIITETMNSFEASYRSMYEDNRILMAFLREAGIPVIKAFLTAADYILNHDLKNHLKEETDPEKIRQIIEEIRKWRLSTDPVELEFAFRHTMIRQIEMLRENPADLSLLERFEESLDLSKDLPLNLNLWPLQNAYHTLAGTEYANFRSRAASGDENAKHWVEKFGSIGKKLNFNLDAVLKPG